MVAARTPSMYVPLDVNFMRDPRIRRAGPEAETLYIRSLAYSKGGGTDGEVPDYDLEVIAVGLKNITARVNALVREGAWEIRDGGWYITGWLNWNEPVAKLRNRKTKQQEGAAKTNHKKHIDNGHPFFGTCAVCLGEVEA